MLHESKRPFSNLENYQSTNEQQQKENLENSLTHLFIQGLSYMFTLTRYLSTAVKLKIPKPISSRNMHALAGADIVQFSLAKTLAQWHFVSKASSFLTKKAIINLTSGTVCHERVFDTFSLINFKNQNWLTTVKDLMTLREHVLDLPDEHDFMLVKC